MRLDTIVCTHMYFYTLICTYIHLYTYIKYVLVYTCIYLYTLAYTRHKSLPARLHACLNFIMLAHHCLAVTNPFCTSCCAACVGLAMHANG